MAQPTVLKRVRNHAEFRTWLRELTLVNDLPLLDAQVAEVTRCWFGLAREHLDDAKSAVDGGCPRAAYSRAYYAAYNASKAVRYHANGIVSLKGDDHQKAGELPDDFPNVATWSARIPDLYQHRLRADYDNWTDTIKENTSTHTDCVTLAEEFLKECEQYLHNKFGIKP